MPSPAPPPSLALAVAVVPRREGGRHLLIRRAPGRPAAGYWTPVTGRVEPGESLEAAAERELFEEVGLRARAGREIFRCPAEGAPFLLVWLEAELAADQDPDALRLSGEVAEARWLPASEAARLAPLFAATRAFYEAEALPAS